MSEDNSTRVVIISGTPGVGKTSIANYLQAEHYTVLNFNQLILDENLFLGYDHFRESVIIDEELVHKFFQDYLTKFPGLTFIEGHTTELIPSEFVHRIFVIRCNPAVLRERLNSRDYSYFKVEENVEAEIMEECYLALRERYPDKLIIQLDSTEHSVSYLANLILKHSS
jgi:adenylate kinase